MRPHLLRLGILGAIHFPLATLIQTRLRSGFRLSAQPLSLLSVGPFGWIQIANFLISGLLAVALAVGLARSGRVGAWAPRFIFVYGAALALAGPLRVDPMLGFPPGTPEGLPASQSWHAIAHTILFFVIFIVAIAAEVATFIATRRSVPALAWSSLAVAIATPVFLVAAGQPPSDSYGGVLFALNLVTNAWLVAIGVHALRTAALAPLPSS